MDKATRVSAKQPPPIIEVLSPRQATTTLSVSMATGAECGLSKFNYPFVLNGVEGVLLININFARGGRGLRKHFY